METEVKRIEHANELAAFDEIRAGIIKIKEDNANLIFDYEDVKGNKDARSHIFKLRQTKTAVAEIHKTTKAKALAACQAIDKEKRDLTAAIEEMIDVHLTPIKAIEERKEAEIAEKLEAERLLNELAEQDRLNIIAKREAELAEKEAEQEAKEEAQLETERKRMAGIREQDRQVALEREKAETERLAKIKAEEDARLAKIKTEEDDRKEAEAKSRAKFKAEEQARLAKIKAEENRITAEREKFEAEKKAEADARQREVEANARAVERAERVASNRAKVAEQEKTQAVEAEKEKARKLEADRIAKEDADARQKERAVEVERERIKDEKHRLTVESDMRGSIFEVIDHEGFADDKRFSKDILDIIAVAISDAIVSGKIKNVTINY